MIAKLHRFTTAIFDRVFRKSKRIHINGFTFSVSPIWKGKNPRFAVVVGKKVSKKAVERNRLRRQLYEIVRQNLVGKIVDKNVIFIYKGAVKFTAQDKFTKACQELVQKLNN
jgi:ribonuclease P protein component